MNINLKIEGDIETRVTNNKLPVTLILFITRYEQYSVNNTSRSACVCVFRTRRQRAASVRPGCDRCVEVGGVGAETGTADTGQPQQGEASRLRH